MRDGHWQGAWDSTFGCFWGAATVVVFKRPEWSTVWLVTISFAVGAFTVAAIRTYLQRRTSSPTRT
jgi:hypothetical protein